MKSKLMQIIPIPIFIGGNIPWWGIIPIVIIIGIIYYLALQQIKETSKGIPLIGWKVEDEI